MIDTDKYEGHTEGHWTWMGEEVFVVEGPTIARIISDNKADTNLMADAPLLLEEVKRLREGIYEVLNKCWPNATTMMRKLKEMIE